MKRYYDFETIWAAKMIIKDIIEAVDLYGVQDEDGDYKLCIGNDCGERVNTWIRQDELDQLRSFTNDI